jgi:hypothetical protein
MSTEKIIEVMAQAIDENSHPVNAARAALTALQSSGYILCQADTCVKGDPVSASPLQSGDGGEAEEALALCIHTLNQIKDRVCGEKVPHWKDPLSVTLSRGLIADHCDATLIHLDRILPPQAQGEIEERSDTDGAEQPGSSLTQNKSCA